MNKRIFLLIFATAVLASCQREQDWVGAPDIKAKVESEQKTRTSLSVDESGAGTIYWNPSDTIDVFFGTKKAQYISQNASNAIAATFKTSAYLTDSDVSSTNIWGLYPSNSSSSCNGSSITTTLPTTQYGVPNTFDENIFPAVAHSSSTTLQFYNVCGGIKFSLYRDDIASITFRGNNNENIAGTVSISFVSGVPKATITSGVKEITLMPKTGTKFVKDAYYYIALLPGTLSNGFTMTFTTTNGTVGTLNYTDNSVTIRRSVFSRKGNMDVYAAFGDGRQPNDVIYYTSEDGNVVTPNNSNVFGASIVSNEYVGGRGIISFDGDVTSVGSAAFGLCMKLSSISMPKSVTSIGQSAFAYNTVLASAPIPDSVTSIGYAAFFGTALNEIRIPKSVTSIGLLSFAGCSELTSIIVDSGNSSYDSRNGCNAIIKTSTNELIAGCMNSFIPNTVQVICERAFYGSTGMTSIVIPAAVTSIGSYSFGKCPGLASIVVESGNPYFDSRNNCNAIIKKNTNELIVGCKNTIIPNSVTAIGAAAFFNCYNCATIEIPQSVASIGASAFQGCDGLSSVFVYATTPPALGSNAFDGTNDCPIYVPAGSVNAYKSAWSDYASRIQAISHNNVIYYTSSDGDYVIPYNTNAFGANIVSNEYDYEKGCFAITFDRDVTGVGDSAFEGCSDLTSITLPASVTSIGYYSFWGCTHLVAYILKSPTPPSISETAFEVEYEGYLPRNYGFHIFVPEGSVGNYCNSWGFYSDRICPINPYIATSFASPTASGFSIQLAEHKVYSAPLFYGINLKDNKGNWVMKNGEWVIGNGFGNNSNGYPLDVLSRDFYNITVQFEFDTSSLPNDIQERISIDWQYSSFSFDYSNVTEPITATFEIPFYVRFDSMMGSFNCYYSVRIYGEK